MTVAALTNETIGWTIFIVILIGVVVYTLINMPQRREVRYSRGAGAMGYRLRELEEKGQQLKLTV